MRVYFAPSYSAYCEPTVGGTVWDIDFDDGYIEKSYVEARTRGYDGRWSPVRIKAITGNEVTLARPLQPCSVLLFQRNTPKDERLVRYGYGGTLLQDESREVANRQALHVIAEIVDQGRLLHESCICGCAEEV